MDLFLFFSVQSVSFHNMIYVALNQHEGELMYTTLLALMFACGDAEETQDIPAPPPKEVKEAPKTAPAKAETPKPAPEEVVVKDESGKDGAVATAAGDG